MNDHIVIVGSGFAAYQLVKSLRKIDSTTAITVITADSGDDYAKPDLSHVFSRQQTASDLIKQAAAEFALTNAITLLNHTKVEAIDAQLKQVNISNASGSKALSYSQLVLATGAHAFVPPFAGNAADEVITLNSLAEYAENQDKIASAKSVLVLGAGLIGTEIAMDLSIAGKQVTLTDKATHIMPSLLPELLSASVYQTMVERGVTLKLGQTVESINRHHQQLIAKTSDDHNTEYDVIIAAMGLKSNITLAKQAGLTTQQGIVVDRYLQTSQPGIYALGDCAEMDGQVRAFLQPTMLSAMALAKTLAGNLTAVTLAPCLVKAKTPWFPLSLSGQTTRQDASWEITHSGNGYLAKAFDPETEQLLGFIASHDQQASAFPLLRQLQ